MDYKELKAKGKIVKVETGEVLGEDVINIERKVYDESTGDESTTIDTFSKSNLEKQIADWQKMIDNTNEILKEFTKG